MDQKDTLLRLAAGIRWSVEGLQRAAGYAIDAELLALGDQLVDLELQLLDLHGQVLKLDGQQPKLRPLVKEHCETASDPAPWEISARGGGAGSPVSG
jgi:hypothetical protein